MEQYADIKRTIKEIKVFLPEQCPFRYWSTIHYSSGDVGEDEFCSYLKSLHKTVERFGSICGRKISYIEDADTTCCCTDDRWIEGCPLLKDDFKIMKN